jgi:hypothetical protein
MNNMKKFLRRMIKNNGFIAKGIYTEKYQYWHDDIKPSLSTINMSVFHELRSKGYIRMDRTGKYYPTEKGIKFAIPWYKRIFYND